MKVLITYSSKTNNTKNAAGEFLLRHFHCSLDITFAYSIEGIGDFSRGLLVQFAHQDDGQQREEEAGDDLIESKERELFPYQYGDAADNDAGQNAVAGSPAPKEGSQQGWAEGSTKSCPGIGHHIQDQAVGIRGQQNGNGCYSQYG